MSRDPDREAKSGKKFQVKTQIERRREVKILRSKPSQVPQLTEGRGT